MPGGEKSDWYVVNIYYGNNDYFICRTQKTRLFTESEAAILVERIQAILGNRDEQRMRAVISKRVVTDSDEVLVELCEELLARPEADVMVRKGIIHVC